MDDVDLFKRAWNVIQSLVGERKISAGHDVSDGGLVTALLEMAFAG
jgi:phosphoribosylformylglycinamidine synthase